MEVEPEYYVTQKVKRSEFLGVGCIVQGLGLVIALASLLLFFIHPLLTVAGLIPALIVLHIGSKASQRHICGHCGNRVEHTSYVCPTCHCHFQ